MENVNYNSLKNIQCGEKYFSSHFPFLYKHIKEKYEHIDKWAEKLYMYFNHIEERPVCKKCGGHVNFKCRSEGYADFCYECAKIVRINRCKEKCKELYGVENVFNLKEMQHYAHQICVERYGGVGSQSEIIKQKIEATNLSKYGCTSTLHAKETRDKVKRLFINKYGVDNPFKSEKIQEQCRQTTKARHGGIGFQSPSIRSKAEITNLSKYGVDNPFKSEKIQEQCRQTMLKRYGYEHALQCDLFLKKFNNTLFIHNKQNKYRSKKEQQICKWLNEMNINYIISCRNLISSELDIVIPSHKIAIEFNGCYWHSISKRGSQYHFNKFEECCEQDLELITIWEDWYDEDPIFVRRFIEDKLSGNPLSQYKSKWFPDLDDNLWPCDLGHAKGEHIEHAINHGKYECFDSGLIKIASQSHIL